MIRIAVIGAGNRAGKYISCLLDRDDAAVTAIVEPSEIRLRKAASLAGVAPEHRYRSVGEFFEKEKDVDAVIITTPDRLHHSVAMGALEKGWHILVEKPLATSWAECVEIADTATEKGLVAGCCLVMRYHPYYQKIKELVDGGAVGRVLSIDHREAIGPDRMSHTFVRGLWSRSEDAAPIFLAKCSHDTDFLLTLVPGRAKTVSSRSSLSLFRKENAPAGSQERCPDCPLERTCPYSASELYLRRSEWISGFDIPEGGSLEDVLRDELRHGRYGRCVYRCDNDVADSQKVDIEMESGVRISVELDGTSLDEGRTIVIRGTAGVLTAGKDIITLENAGGNGRFDFRSENKRPLHAGADRAVIEDFISAIRSGSEMRASLASTLEAHRICIEAE